MGFTTKNLVAPNRESFMQEQQPQVSNNEDLSLLELEFLLSTLKNVDLKGYQVELFYNLIVKIQNQYIKKQNK